MHVYNGRGKQERPSPTQPDQIALRLRHLISITYVLSIELVLALHSQIPEIPVGGWDMKHGAREAEKEVRNRNSIL